jgi:peptidoglycan/LPS O-acetylase OafA/YrhL
MHHLERTATERPGPLGYEPALDGIRAVAVSAVVGFHAFGIPRGGFLGVDLFFVLSGFLITSILVREYSTTGMIALGRFVQRRALRLFPALLALLALYAAAVGIKIAVTGTLGDEPLIKAVFGVVAGILYFSNIVTAHHVGLMPGSLVHLWSLAAEEQFYIFWPISLLVVLRWRPRLLPWLLVAAIAAVAAHRLTLALSGASWSRLYFAPDTRADALFVGCLFGYWRALRAPAIVARIASLRWTPTIAAAGIIALLALSRYKGRFVYEAGMSALLLCCGLFIFAITIRSGGLSGRVLRLSPVVYVGRISYSVYLWHVPILTLLGAATVGQIPLHDVPRAIFGVACSFAAAALSYRLIETPFLRRKQKLSRSPRRDSSVPIGAAVAPARGA